MEAIRCVRIGVGDRMDAAVAEDGKVLAKVDLGDIDGSEEVRLVGAIEDRGERGEDGVVVGGVSAELSDGLGDEYVEPV